MHYYNGARTHLSLNKDAPLPRAVQAVGRILPTPILGGLHHHFSDLISDKDKRHNQSETDEPSSLDRL
jgi:hypothetical protein